MGLPSHGVRSLLNAFVAPCATTRVVRARNRAKDIPCWCTILCCTIFPIPGFCKSFESNVTVAPSGVVPGGGPDSMSMER